MGLHINRPPSLSRVGSPAGRTVESQMVT